MIAILYHPKFGAAVVPCKGAFSVDIKTGRTESTMKIATMNNNGKIDHLDVPLDGVIKVEFLLDTRESGFQNDQDVTQPVAPVVEEAPAEPSLIIPA